MKQIRNGDVVGAIMDRGDGYFHWLQKVSGLSGPLSSMLAGTDFVSIDKLDDVLIQKTKEEVRSRYADYIAEKDDLNDKEIEKVLESIRGSVCLFEVIICLSYSINEMFEGDDAYDGCEHFFGVLMHNCGLDIYDEEDMDTIGEEVVKKSWEKRIRIIIEREYGFYGNGGLFPMAPSDEGITDRRYISLWQQMNDWVDQHTDEDGEWVD